MFCAGGYGRRLAKPPLLLYTALHGNRSTQKGGGIGAIPFIYIHAQGKAERHRKRGAQAQIPHARGEPHQAPFVRDPSRREKSGSGAPEKAWAYLAAQDLGIGFLNFIPMPLFQKINDDMKAAMKSGDKARLETLRFTLATLNAAQKEKALKDPRTALTDEEVVTLLQKEAKKRKDSIELFRQGKRDDLVEQESAGLKVIYEYLPQELSREEIVAIVNDLKEKGVASDFSGLMKETMKIAKGRADGKLVGDIIRDVERG